jgi:tRNA-(ms[2]io[6]A)-hydroxylase
MADKRRLPVLQPKEDEGEARPAWQWVAIGLVATVLAWLPLAALSGWFAKRTYERHLPSGDAQVLQQAFRAMAPADRLWLGVLVVIGPMVALALAAFLGGALVGRFGGGAGAREATFAGIAAAAICALLAGPGMWAQPGGELTWLAATAIVTTLAAVMSYLGGKLGLKLRR